MYENLYCAVGENNLICTLSRSDRALIEPCLEHVQLKEAAILEEADTPVSTVYFLSSGIGSSVADFRNTGQRLR